jgi:hypothetical protein
MFRHIFFKAFIKLGDVQLSLKQPVKKVSGDIASTHLSFLQTLRCHTEAPDRSLYTHGSLAQIQEGPLLL